MGDERRGVNLSLRYQPERLLAVAPIHTSCLKGQVLAIHIGQGEHLWLVIEGYDRDDGIGTRTSPRQTEGVLGARHFQHTVSSTMVAVGLDHCLALLGRGEQHVGIVGPHKVAARRR